MEGGDLRVVPLKVREVEVVGQRLLTSVESHRLEERLPPSLHANQWIRDQFARILIRSFLLIVPDPNPKQRKFYKILYQHHNECC